MTDKLLNSLNDVQREAVQHVEGPALCLLSGAGSGKTRVITHRIAYLIKRHGISPFRILAVTFTNKAANEMKERLDVLISENISKDVWVATFHGTCARILRQEIDKLEGYTRAFTIFDTTDQAVVVKEALKKLGYENKQHNPRAILSHISRAKNDFLKPAAYADIAGDYFEEIVAQVYPIYQDLLRRNNALDFDDLLLSTLELFEDYPDVLKNYQRKFRYILVDEFQDTNQCQYRIVRRLAEPEGNLCVVGDDDQSIYAFRGADIRNILNFEKDYGDDAKVFPLEQNYRSTKNILDAAWNVVRNNKARKPKKLWTENEEGDPVICYEAINESDEANYVATQIENLHVEGVNYADFAIFYRTTAQSRIFEEALRAANIPYQIVGGVGFYDRMEIKDLLAYLRVMCNPDDSISLRRIINVPGRGIGMKTIQRLIDFAVTEQISLFEAVERVNEISQISSGIKAKVRRFNKIFDDLSNDILPSDALYHVLQTTKYLENLESQNTLEAQGRIENIEQLISAVTEYESDSSIPTLADYLENVALTTDVDAMETDETNIVPLMTLHSAKGLEFPFVFIVGVEEGYLPHQRSIDEATEAAIEEERRLCYVGITRAMERLYLIHADSRRMFGNSEYRAPSRFISEIPDHLIKRVDRYHSPFLEAESAYESVSEESSDYYVDQIIDHPQFGRGKVTKISGAGQDVYVTVRFSRAGMTKQFAASLAPLTISDY
ncbi:MAG: UvrD-helicase domain-containing protein [Candidatus Poribacteria bacterium]|nr:UvrD-helicase domain-containing protein [Candidatus Poribacteria bacterium]